MPPDYAFQIISCQCIEFNPFIRLLQEGPADSSLVNNLQRFGQTTPLLVWQHTEKKYQLLAGHNTFKAITSLGIEKAFCHVLPSSISPVQRYSLQILHGLVAPLASPILQAHLLHQARQELTDNELLALLSLMGYKPQRYLFDELTALLQLSSSAVLALHHGILSPKAAKLFKLISHEDQEMLVRLIDTYRPGGSKQHKLIEMVTEVSLRNNKPVQEVIRELLPANQDGVQDNTPQRLQGILHSLQKMYWPERTKLERDFQKFVQELHLPDGVTVESSSSFEDEGIEMRFHFANNEALKEKWNLIKTIVQQ